MITRKDAQNYIEYLKGKKGNAIAANLRHQEVTKRMYNIVYLLIADRLKIDDIPNDEYPELSHIVEEMYEEFICRGNPYRIIDLPLPEPEVARYCCSHIHDRSNESWAPVNRIAH